jgi:hypothetical protein
MQAGLFFHPLPPFFHQLDRSSLPTASMPGGAAAHCKRSLTNPRQTRFCICKLFHRARRGGIRRHEENALLSAANSPKRRQHLRRRM